MNEIDVLATDKTGTLTENKLSVGNILTGLEMYNVNTTSHNVFKSNQAFQQLTAACLLNNTYYLRQISEPLSVYRETHGDELERALLEFAKIVYVNCLNLSESFEIVYSLPFSNVNRFTFVILKRKQMNEPNDPTVFDDDCSGDEFLMLIKGAPDHLLHRCSSFIGLDGKPIKLEEHVQNEMANLINNWSICGDKVILVCKKGVSKNNEILFNWNSATQEQVLIDYVNESDDFCLLGIVGLEDKLREDTYEAMSACRRAGLKVIMITGDYSLTAAAVALDAGILRYPQYDTIVTVHSLADNPTDSHDNLTNHDDIR
jgi:sodium/potassium-transporting ATPase subunit alpha